MISVCQRMIRRPKAKAMRNGTSCVNILAFIVMSRVEVNSTLLRSKVMFEVEIRLGRVMREAGKIKM